MLQLEAHDSESGPVSDSLTCPPSALEMEIKMGLATGAHTSSFGT